MKKFFGSLIVASLLSLHGTAFAFYPTATPHLLNKGNMLSSPANPYIGDKYVAALFYGNLNLSDSDDLETYKSDFYSLSADIPVPALGKSVVSVGYEGLNNTKEFKTALSKEKKTENSTVALQFSSQIGESLKGSVKVRMEKTEFEKESNDFSEYEVGLNYMLPNHCELGLHVSPKGDSESTDLVQAGFGCMIGKTLAFGLDVNRLKHGDHDAQNGVVLSGEYLHAEKFDVELILILLEEEKEAELTLSYLVSSVLLRASYLYVSVDEEHLEYTKQGFAVGVVGSF